MEKNDLIVPAAHSGARQPTWNSRIESGRVAVTSMSGRGRTEPMSMFKAMGARPLGRTLALWIIVGALWISLGMIVSAALVTVAFLT